MTRASSILAPSILGAAILLTSVCSTLAAEVESVVDPRPQGQQQMQQVLPENPGNGPERQQRQQQQQPGIGGLVSGNFKKYTFSKHSRRKIFGLRRHLQCVVSAEIG